MWRGGGVGSIAACFPSTTLLPQRQLGDAATETAEFDKDWQSLAGVMDKPTSSVFHLCTTHLGWRPSGDSTSDVRR